MIKKTIASFFRELQIDFFEQSWHCLIFQVCTASIGRSVMKSWDNSQILCLLQNQLSMGRDCQAGEHTRRRRSIQ